MQWPMATKASDWCEAKWSGSKDFCPIASRVTWRNRAETLINRTKNLAPPPGQRRRVVLEACMDLLAFATHDHYVAIAGLSF